MVVLICNSMETNNIEQFFMCLLALHLSLLLGTVCKSYACSLIRLSSYCCCSVAKSCPALCNHMNCTMPGFPVLHYLPELAQTHVHWVGDSIQPSPLLVIPFSSCLQSFPASGYFPVSWFFASGGQSISLSISLSREYSGLISFRIDWFDLAVQGALKSLLQHHSSKASIFQGSAFFMVQLSHPYMTTGKTIALTRWVFVGKIMSLLFNMLSRLVITFLPRSKHLLIPWLQSPSAVILEPKKIKSVTVFPSIFHKAMGADAMILVFWMLSFMPMFSLSFFIKMLFSFSLLSAIRVVSSAYLRLLVFLLAILTPVCASSSPGFHIMYYAYKLNMQGDDIQAWCTPFPTSPLFIYKSNCCFLTCIQISQGAGKVGLVFSLLKNFLQFIVIHTKALA